MLEKLNVIVTGKTGVGKSYLGCALGQLACRRGQRVIYRRLPRLFAELALAKADGTYHKRLAKIAKADVLVLDDLGIGTGLKEAHRHDLLEVMEDRYGRSSTIVTSQLDSEHWHEWIGDPTSPTRFRTASSTRLQGHPQGPVPSQGEVEEQEELNQTPLAIEVITIRRNE